MFLLLLLIPIFTIFSAFAVYRYAGEKRFLKLDLIQFLQAFVLLPILLIWSKSFLYYILSHELDATLSSRDLVIFDTMLTVALFYIFAFTVLHSLTKTFSIRKEQDPLYDLFELSEYFHHSVSHIMIYGGAFLVTTFFSTLNIFFPLDIVLGRSTFYGLLILGVISGIIAFLIILNYEVEDHRFMKIMKLLIGGTVIWHILTYFLIDIPFRAPHTLYWFFFMTFLSLSVSFLFSERSRRANSFFTRLHALFQKKRITPKNQY